MITFSGVIIKISILLKNKNKPGLILKDIKGQHLTRDSKLHTFPSFLNPSTRMHPILYNIAEAILYSV